jgi:hypothetical protein
MCLRLDLPFRGHNGKEWPEKIWELSLGHQGFEHFCQVLSQKVIIAGKLWPVWAKKGEKS